MGMPIVPTDTAGRKPNYPYMAYKITTPYEGNTFSLADEAVPSENPKYDYDIKVTRKEQPHFTLSMSAYSDDEDKARDTAQQAADWFKFIGYHYFVTCNIVVISTTNVTDRTQQLVDDYERRYGFDVRIRAARSISKRIEGMETFNFDSTINNPHPATQ